MYLWLYLKTDLFRIVEGGNLSLVVPQIGTSDICLRNNSVKIWDVSMVLLQECPTEIFLMLLVLFSMQESAFGCTPGFD